ncbi:MAG: AbrB family transcriptional regulator [Mangrovicoccus sp.]|nr:AbrB family transcriptional regulator [Mangrovicoccus sp.]
MQQWRALAVTLVLGALGAGVFSLIGFPVAPLTGAAVAVSLAGLAGVALALPDWLRNLTFLTLGINIGSSVTPELLTTAAQWPGSFAVLALTLVASMLICRRVLQRLFGFERGMAALCSAPGHLSYVLSLAADTGRDLAVLSIAQSTRVLVLTLIVPPLIAGVFGATGAQVLPEALMSWPHALALYALAAALAIVMIRLRIPAAYLLAAMVISALGHLGELAPGRLPSWASTSALVVMGALIGTRFHATNRAQLIQGFLAGLVVTSITLGIAVLGALGVMAWFDLPLSLVLVAFAPGGVEAMAAIALQLGLDPPFVAGHHVMRLMILSLLLPLLMRQRP